jgi:hypothetical protein
MLRIGAKSGVNHLFVLICSVYGPTVLYTNSVFSETCTHLSCFCKAVCTKGRDGQSATLSNVLGTSCSLTAELVTVLSQTILFSRSRIVL